MFLFFSERGWSLNELMMCLRTLQVWKIEGAGKMEGKFTLNFEEFMPGDNQTVINFVQTQHTVDPPPFFSSEPAVQNICVYLFTQRSCHPLHRGEGLLDPPPSSEPAVKNMYSK